jgi:SulP family sulfate permease
MDVPVIGAIPKELPPFRFAEIFKLHFSDLKYIITPAIMLGGLGLIDTLLTSVVADNITKTKHNSKWTVIGQGIGNIFAAMFGGIPGAGATMGTVTNIKSGAKTKLSGIMKGVFLLLIILSISDFIQFIPMSVLAGILITIGIGIIDYKGVKLLLKVPRQDTAVWLIVLLVTLFDNLLDAVGVGFVLSAIFFIGKMSKHLNQLLTSSTIEGTVVNEDIPDIIKNKIHVKKLEGPLFFGFADAFRAECQQIDHVLAVILNMKYVPFLDQSGIVTLESVIGEWHDRGIQVYITGGNASVLESLNKVELIPDLISLNNCFDCFEDCLLTIAKKVKNSEGIGQCEEALLDDKVLLTRKRLVLNPN